MIDFGFDKIALIGAGPSGLAGARCLQKHGIPFQGFEAHTDVGGLWNIHNPRSTVYESAHLISSKRMTEFSEFPMADRVADYPSHRELLEYFIAFADHFRLREHYRFGVRVRSVVPVSDAPDTLWRVTLEDADGLQTAADYKGVVVANGTLAEPNMPRFEGHFAGELLHTSAYKTAAQFTGKRVLIVGAGNSGCDIAVDAVHYAKSVDISVRRGYYFVPKYVFGKPADTLGGKLQPPPWLKQKMDSTILQWFTGDPVRFGFPKPTYKMYESHPVVNSLILHHLGHGDIHVKADVARFDGATVHFKDGTQGDYDMVLAATGYKLHYPFLDHALQAEFLRHPPDGLRLSGGGLIVVNPPWQFDTELDAIGRALAGLSPPLAVRGAPMRSVPPWLPLPPDLSLRNRRTRRYRQSHQSLRTRGSRS